MTGAEKASSLADFIEVSWRDLGEPCSARTIDMACRFADIRCRAFDPATAVLAHGDAHAWNTLVVPGGGARRFKFVDPDGLFVERAYDLAIPMREWGAELLAGDPVALLTTVMLPGILTAVVGLNCTTRVMLWVGVSVTGALPPVIV